MPNEDQIAYWNGQAGEKWVQNAEQLDNLLAPFLPEILSRAALNEGEHVLDIGCGAGALTLQAERQVGTKRSAIGIDISEPLLALARQRAETAALAATFTKADASVYRAAQPLDAAVSRFGVMFFSDPVGAFEALRRNLRPEGRMVFACWKGLEHNGWASLALHAAMPFLSEPPPPPDPKAPGPFAFADKDRISRNLSDAGWRGISIDSWTGQLDLPGHTAEESADFLLKMGPMARVLSEQVIDIGPVRDAVVERIKSVSLGEGLVKLPAASWLVTATAS